MDAAHALIDWSPLLRLLGLAAVIALLPLSWWWLRQRGAPLPRKLAALTALILFLTVDLIAVGAFTRLTDSGLGCPDWPGCYGELSPWGAKAEISAAQAAQPTGPVTHGKAWIEMLHRYLAMAVGALILVAAAMAWRARDQLPHSPWWATATLFWVLVQGAFGKYTVTLKLYPAVVTLHLLGAQLLLALLVLQHESFRARPLAVARQRLAPAWVAVVLALVVMQIALGGWVSTNYAVLACQGFPTCNGQWWPQMDAAHGFTLLRHLGQTGQGGALPFDALVAIHMAHRLFAVVLVLALVALAVALRRSGDAVGRRYALALGGLLLWQLASGLSNVVLGWPIAAALAHSVGAAGLVAVLTSLWARLRQAQSVTALAPAVARRPAGGGAVGARQPRAS
ncbi:COX15/CtaA family protein [Pseudaquabacterium pictum]|uniref:Cytochrome c oxidase subunit I n=1 Tax=Pseudaquabacterium pictum TaxID=2315236 RepID=A0A480AQB3_9BURK|nr:COX15/CtaA family protein [Rubrivivax pictus]GCL62272.1 cytochrome c oxidase subunit I [Rubrivivax pictus]